MDLRRKIRWNKTGQEILHIQDQVENGQCKKMIMSGDTNNKET